MNKNRTVYNYDNTDRIFRNRFTLTINSEALEENYELKISNKKTAMFIYILLQISILHTCITLPLDSKINLEYSMVEYYSYFCISFLLISFILFFMQLFNHEATSSFLYFNFISLQMIVLFFQEYMKIALDTNFNDYDKLIYAGCFKIILCYILFFDNNFLRVFKSIIINFITYSVLVIVIEPNEFFKIINLGCALLIRVVFCYVWCRLSKEAFYYREKLEAQTNLQSSILNNLNSGVFAYNLNNHKVNFSNDYFNKFDEFQEDNQSSELSKNNDGSRLEINLNERYGYKNMDKAISKFNIFKMLFNLNVILPEEIKAAFLTNDFLGIIDFINNYYPNESNNIFFNGFVFIGQLFLKCQNNKVLFELFLHGFTIEKCVLYEIVIIDVSKTKQIDEEIFKNKTLILGKISHEFKNPLIVVDEVIDQIIEIDDNNMKTSEVTQKMSLVKNLCNYMLILVKDFEVVASIENALEIKPCFDKVDIKPFLFEIGNIIETLIKKKAAPNLLFHLNFDKSLYYIFSDSLRLKQILINLLSNSVKFTNAGIIELKVDIFNTYVDEHHSKKELDEVKEESKIETAIVVAKTFIRFSIIDSGKGISEKLVKLINSEENVKVFQKDQSASNNIGTGYGLNIVQRLCKVLNSKLYVQSIQASQGSVGTIFYFDLLHKKENGDDLDKGPIVIMSNFNTDDKQDLDNKVEDKDSYYYNLDNKLIFDKFPKNDKYIFHYSNKIDSERIFDFNKYTFDKDDYMKIKNNSQNQIESLTDSPLFDLQDIMKTKKYTYDINLPQSFFNKETEIINPEVDEINQSMKQRDTVSNQAVSFYYNIYIFRSIIQARRIKAAKGRFLMILDYCQI